MGAEAAVRLTRQNSRRQHVLDAAARLFCTRGFHATSVRDIAAAVGVVPASLYAHFPSKDDLLLAVYAAGVSRIAAQVDAAVAAKAAPRDRLAAACEAHLETLLDRSDYAQVVIRVLPQDVPSVASSLIALRDDYEARFARLIDALDLPPATDHHYLRLLLLGALNAAQGWYRPGRDTPRRIARNFLKLLDQGIKPRNEERHD